MAENSEKSNSEKSNSNEDPVARGDTDLMLDAQQLRLEGVSLSLAGLLNVKIKHLEAELMLKADLEEVAGVLRELVSTLGKNPDLLQNLLQSLTTTVEGVADAATDDAESTEYGEPTEDEESSEEAELSEGEESTGDAEENAEEEEAGKVPEVRLTADEDGNLVETSFDEGGQITGEETVGALEDLDITDAAGEKAIGLGVDLSSVEGTGQGGRILVKDVEDAAEEAG